MSKRAPQFERRERDFYPTPREAVLPLLPFLTSYDTFCEPCAGDGALVRHIEDEAFLKCVLASDIEPQGAGIVQLDARGLANVSADCFITNPPWERKTLHPIIMNLSEQRPTWLLFDADWMHTKQAAPFLPRLQTVVSVGRVKWIPDSKFTGKDNCCWYLFDRYEHGRAEFIGRAA